MTMLATSYRHDRRKDFIISLILGGLAMIAGLIGVYQVMVKGFHGNLTSYVPWGLGVSVYVYLVWLEVGMILSYFLLKHVLKVPGIDKLGPVVLMAAMAALIGALTIIGMDLGHPFRFYRAFVSPNFSSMMTWMIWLHSGYLLLLAVELWAYHTGRKQLVEVLSMLSVPAGVALIAVIGGLFGVIAARPFWNASVLPLAFFISSIVAGTGLLTVLHLLFSPGVGTEAFTTTGRELGRIFKWAMLVGILAAAANLLVIAYPNVPAHAEGLRLVLFGPYSWTIWGVHLLIGTLVPMILLTVARRSLLAVGVAAALMVTTFVVVPLNIVIPGLAYPPPDLAGLAAAYTDNRLTYDYFPNASEWLMVLFAIGLALVMFALGYRFVLEGYFRRAYSETTPAKVS